MRQERSLIHTVILFLKRPFKFDVLNRLLPDNSFNFLDVGCGNHSARITKRYFPNCRYYGLDKARNYNLDDQDLRLTDQFFEIDLSKPDQLDNLPDDFFDCIVLSHVIEHLENGEAVLGGLHAKLKRNGFLYLEFPSPHSVRLPRIKGIRPLNFYEDPTHVRIYKVKELNSFLKGLNYRILKSGIRTSLKGIFLIPVYLLRSLLSRTPPTGAVFWDITGFASYILAQKE